MIGPLALALGLTTISSDDAIVLQERVPLAVLISSPTGESANISSSELIRIISDLLEKHTNLFPQIAEAQVVTDCRGHIYCLVAHMRPDYNREAMQLESGSLMPFAEHLRELRDRKTVYPHFLLLISNVTLQGQADRITASLLDTDIALEYFHSASRQDPDWERETDARISEYATVYGPLRGEVKNAKDVADYIARLSAEGLEPFFTKNNNWEPYGTVEIKTGVEGVAINLDGTSVGTTKKGITRLERVTNGARRLTFEHPSYAPYSTEVLVDRNQTVSVEVDFSRLGVGSAPIIRSAVTYGGAGMAAVGVALTLLATVRKDSNVATYCFDSAGSSCRDRDEFQTLGYKPDAAASGGDPNPSGLLLAPMGYSLALTGAVWTLGTLFIGDQSDIPWLQLIAGVAIGAASYGLSAALNPN